LLVGRARNFSAERDGYAATTLPRSVAPQAEFRFVNDAEVNSVQAWQTAVQDPAFPRDLPRLLPALGEKRQCGLVGAAHSSSGASA
jgi:hypothetical protein